MLAYDVVCGRELNDLEVPEHLMVQRLKTSCCCFCSAECRRRFQRDPHRYLYPYLGAQRAFASVARSAPEFVSVPAGLLPRTYGSGTPIS